MSKSALAKRATEVQTSQRIDQMQAQLDALQASIDHGHQALELHQQNPTVSPALQDATVTHILKGIRSSERERDAVIEALSQTAAEGRIDMLEFEARTDHMLRSQTISELEALTSDLPIKIDQPKPIVVNQQTTTSSKSTGGGLEMIQVLMILSVVALLGIFGMVIGIFPAPQQTKTPIHQIQQHNN